MVPNESSRLNSKRRKERTVAKVLIKKFKSDHLLEGPSSGDRNTFEFLDIPDVERTEILFHGPKTKYLRAQAAKYLRTLDSAEKDPRKMAVIMRLVNVEGVSKEEYSSYLEIQEKKRKKKAEAVLYVATAAKVDKATVVLPPKDLPVLTPADQVQRSSVMKDACDNIERFHKAEMLLGRKRGTALVSLPNKGVGLEYFYVNDAEALHAASLAESTLAYEPDIQTGEGDERYVLRYELKDFGAVPAFMPHKSRKLSDVDPYTAACFALTHLLGFRFESHESQKLGFATFTFLDRAVDTENVAEMLGRYGLTVLVHDERRQNIYLATNETAEKAFKWRGKTASEIIRGLSESYNKPDGLAVVREVFKKIFGWRLLAEYFYVANVNEEDERLLYVAVTPTNMELKKKLQDNYQKVISMLPAGVTASFQGIRVVNGKSFFIYFEDRKVILQRITEKISQSSKARHANAQQRTTSSPALVELNGTEKSPVSMNGTHESHILDRFVSSLTASEVILLKKKLNITEGPSKEELEAHDAECDRKRAEELEKRFEGHVILNTDEKKVREMMNDYHERLFMNLKTFLEPKKQDA